MLGMAAYIFLLQFFSTLKNTPEGEVEPKHFDRHVIIGNHRRIAGHKNREIDTIMIENRFQLKPVGNFGTAANVGQVGQYHFLIHGAHDHVGAETLRMLLDFGPEFVFGKRNSLVKHIEPAVVTLYDALTKRIGEVKEINLTRVHLTGKAGIV